MKLSISTILALAATAQALSPPTVPDHPAVVRDAADSIVLPFYHVENPPSTQEHKRPCPGKMRHAGEHLRGNKGSWGGLKELLVEMGLLSRPRPHWHRYSNPIISDISLLSDGKNREKDIVDIRKGIRGTRILVFKDGHEITLPPPLIDDFKNLPMTSFSQIEKSNFNENKGWVKVETIDHPVKPFLLEDMKDMKKHVEDMLKDSNEKGEKGLEGFVPLLESGSVKILPFHPASILPTMEVMTVDGEEPKLPFRHWHHRRPNSFGGRAIRHLSPAESLSLAFVLGAGIGSILHFIFMVFILLSRRFRCSRVSREDRVARRAARKEERRNRKAIRKAAKAELKGGKGQIRLEGDDEGVVNVSGNVSESDRLPSYEEGQVREVVEDKA